MRPSEVNVCTSSLSAKSISIDESPFKKHKPFKKSKFLLIYHPKLPKKKISKEVRQHLTNQLYVLWPEPVCVQCFTFNWKLLPVDRRYITLLGYGHVLHSWYRPHVDGLWRETLFSNFTKTRTRPGLLWQLAIAIIVLLAKSKTQRLPLPGSDCHKFW